MGQILTGHVQIKDNDILVRDLFSKGIINTNEAAYHRAKRLHREALQKVEAEQRLEAKKVEERELMQDQLNILSRDMAGLKQNIAQLTALITKVVGA